MTMPVLPVTPSSTAASEPAAHAGGADATVQAPAFAKVLSQQKSQGATDSRPPAGAKAGARADEHDAKPADEAQDPDATLTLILDSAALPLMQLPATDADPASRGTAKAGQGADAPESMLTTPVAAGALLAVAADAVATPAPDSSSPADASRPSAAAHSPQITGLRLAQAGRQPLATTGTASPASSGPAGANGGDADSRLPAALTLPRDAAAALSSDLSSSQSAAARALPHPDNAAGAAPDAAGLLAALAASAGSAAGQPAPVAGPTVALAVPSPMSSAQWMQDFTRQIVSYAQSGANGIHTVQLHVNPPELGPVHIMLQIGDATTQAAFMSPHAQVRQTLENALPSLAQQFAQAGLSLGQANVSDQQAGQQGFFGQSAFAGTPARADTGFSLNTDASLGIAALPQTARSGATARRPDTLVDTFV